MTESISRHLPPAVEFRNVCKSFGDVSANAGVTLKVEAGTIHGVIGENGAGKSTAMKILYGIYSKDSGEILVDGMSRNWTSPSDAIETGIGMVHQHFMLAGPYTALDNILLGAEPLLFHKNWLPKAFSVINRAKARNTLETLAKKYALPVDFGATIETLPVGLQQRIEILKLLYREARILILDEPTAVLTPQEINELFLNLRKLRDEGKTIIIITHKLREVMSLTDRVTVFRSGRVTGEVTTSETSELALARLMVGRDVNLRADVAPASNLGDPVLEVKKLTVEGKKQSTRKALDGVTFTVNAGEIVGIAGVEGNGQSELLKSVLRPLEMITSDESESEIRVLGQDVTDWETSDIKDLGVGMIPEDRQHGGLLLDMPVRENYLLGLQYCDKFNTYGKISYKALENSVTKAVEEYDVRPRNIEVLAGDLSGGNQQKVVIAREFDRNPKLLIAAQPTRGVDVGAVEFIHGQIVKARDGGTGVLLVSSELDEVMTLSDRILVMYEGEIAAEFKKGEFNEETLGFYMGGGRKRGHA